MYELGVFPFGQIIAGTAKHRHPFNSRLQQTEKHSKTTLMILNKRACLIILSLLSLVKSSTTTRSPDLLLVVLLFLQHLTSLSRILLDAELHSDSPPSTPYSSKTVSSLELLHIVQRVVDQGETAGAASSYA